MWVIYLLLFIAAALCFLAAALGRWESRVAVGLVPLGLFLWVLVYIIELIVAHAN